MRELETNHDYALAALEAIHRALHNLLDDEDLDGGKLLRASETVLPACADWAAYGIREGTRGPKPPGGVPWPRPEIPYRETTWGRRAWRMKIPGQGGTG